MSYLVLARRWRPAKFHDLVGQDVVIRTLKNAFSSQSLAHAYLLTGIRGVGKTTIARLMAMAVNCASAVDGEPCGSCDACQSIVQGRNLDVQEMDAASHTGVEDIREILDGVRYPPVSLTYKVYIIDEAHMLSKSAFNALLKTLEEPPAQVLFILATTESDKLPITVRSRCQRFDLRRLSVDEIRNYLAYVLGQEAVEAESEALQRIARASDGSVRDALSLTERVLAYSGKQISVQDVHAALGLIGPEILMSISDAIAAGDAGEAVSTLRHAATQGYAARALLLALSELWHELACAMVNPDWLDQEDAWLTASTGTWTVHELDLRYQVLIHGLRDLALQDEQRGTEMILMRLCFLVQLGEAPLPKRSQPVLKNPPNPANSAKPINPTSQASVYPKADDVGVAPISTMPVSATSDSSLASASAVPIHAAASAPALNQGQAPATGHAYSNWKDVLEAFAEVSPEVSAVLEHVLCAEFSANRVRLLLEKFQLQTFLVEDRQAFSSWLGCEVIWEQKKADSNVVVMETVSQIRHREADEKKRQLWAYAEQNQTLRNLTQDLEFRLVDVQLAGDVSDAEMQIQQEMSENAEQITY
ncbi:MAG: DNA polymerase III subunit gamma/tau [Zetaproteobacteria bacterium CG_4_9_14_3_um_filter_49_83]|nr:MAG: DNA polymerase III, subunit gamma and tau [Zetaproteobacteria bacterium CG1_02_49_23]PIQ30702.1 MAG: DNA polymerase III subunit gamma/tau [Zetaproteobacteria bacterium CG17_big_fil_post_rev_8_21_14_2_50_50_13]PIV30914.1 MAG: DNA polymerase III subunit gamma/tau [Zetaproteobacteria bacterium CG02_land_8_20_14_3_00_50_9]PIY57193.1 MAG: DNA polymerase III subunit gamma/tau [Zetaproteobacteria bacterium CG_4_10_14_0_8_um_filter_49_80]PJA34468.1 MAG: DNA polymerase III subunit gamma/tau [Zet